MRILRELRALGLVVVMSPGLALANNLDKSLTGCPTGTIEDMSISQCVSDYKIEAKAVSSNKAKASRYTGEQLFKAAYKAYVCSFLMHLSDQIEKAKFLRSYSVKLMEKNEVMEYGKNWNDVNFPTAYDANELSLLYSDRPHLSGPL